MRNKKAETRSEADRPIRVCFIATGADLGGAPRSLLEMVGALAETKLVEPYVILKSGGALESKLDRLGIPWKVIRFPSSVRSKKWPSSLKMAAERVSERILAKELRKGGFDLVHNNGIIYGAGIRAAHSAGIPCICHVREFAQRENGLEFLDEARQRAALRMCSHVIFISHSVAKRFADWVDGLDHTVLYNGFDVSRYLLKHDPLFEGPVSRLLLAGHITPTKGQLEAVRAVCALRKRGRAVSLTIVGHVRDKAYDEELRAVIQQERAEGFIELKEFTDDLSSLRARHDISLICSIANEGLGRVTIEGMLAGCLAVGSNKGGTIEVIENGQTGLIYDGDSYLDLANTIENAILHPDAMNRIAKQGQSRAKTLFDSKDYAYKIYSIYRGVLEN